MVSSGGRVPATLESVAAAAGVSRATASRVLTGSPRVSEAARDKVLAAASSLAYVPNAAARSLVTRRSDTVAFVVCEPEEKFFSDPFFATVLKGAHRIVAAHSLQLVFVVVATDEDRDQLERFAAGGHLDAAMFVSLHGSEDMPARLDALGLPVVMAGRSLDPGAAGLPVVDVDNAQGAGVATRRLVERGCRRIGTISGPTDMAGSMDRLDGWREAMAAAGRTPHEDDVVTGDYTVEGGHEAMVTLLDRGPEVDGVFCANDLMAAGALRAIADRGLSVPDDVAVVGFDDIPVALATQPPLTTVHQPIEELGRRMAQSLVTSLVAGEPAPQHVRLHTHLVVRGSA
ncbi:LacI family DNA-binding transcriptional regulator [Aquipuribacter hungaricus]|uniref:LacI family DNA-binding transcriptional regulator n=1 Tax=Aquipuribacter hungaricus TaxID=545624 RepID=A0ABV7WHF0_9MICO